MEFCHLQENVEINMVKINEYCNKNRNAARKFGDKYGKNLMDTARKTRNCFAKTAGKK